MYAISGQAANPTSLPSTDLQQIEISLKSEAIPTSLPYNNRLAGSIDDWDIMTFDGAWGREYLIKMQALPVAGYRCEQRRGRCASETKPFWILRNRKNNRGIAIALAYMGNWTFEVKPVGNDIEVKLDTSPSAIKPFAKVKGLPVPGALINEFIGSWDQGCQPIVQFAQKHLLRNFGPSWPIVQYNTWYTDYENIDEAKLLDSAKRAASFGCELFVIDAGWFGGTKNAADWNQGLGDWVVNRQRLPNGVETIEKAVRVLKMKFGMWIEIECAHPASPIAQEHPDWFLMDASGKRIGSRDVLNFGKDEVLTWAKSRISELMNRYRLDYIKMDMNVDPYIDDSVLPKSPLIGHYKGLSDLWRWMRKTWPKLIVENCASGSLRQDYMSIAHTDTHWVSDGEDHKLSVPYMMGATYFMPSSISSHWTVNPSEQEPTMTIEAQYLVHLMGHFGISGNIDNLSKETESTIRKAIKVYKEIRPFLANADVHHLTEIWKEGPQAALYVDRMSGKAILYAFQCGSDQMAISLEMPKLAPKKVFKLKHLAGTDSVSLISNSEIRIGFRNKGDAAVWLLN